MDTFLITVAVSSVSFFLVITWRLSLARPSTFRRWKHSQDEYVGWSEDKLPEDYRQVVSSLLERFDQFTGPTSPGNLVLDVGCGSDRIGGMSYQEFFGFDDSKAGGWVGIDPLPGRCTVRAVAEALPFIDCAFEKVTVKTSLDHFIDLRVSLSEMQRVGRELDLWFTETRDPDDHSHAYRVNLRSLAELIPVKTFVKEPFRGSQVADTVFVKAGP